MPVRNAGLSNKVMILSIRFKFLKAAKHKNLVNIAVPRVSVGSVDRFGRGKSGGNFGSVRGGPKARPEGNTFGFFGRQPNENLT